MAHPVSNWIHLHGNKQAQQEWSRIQNGLIQNHASADGLSRADFLKVLGSQSVQDLLPASTARWPKWVAFEFNSPETLSFTSANWPVFEIQDLLTSRLMHIDAQAITVLEWQNWPLACGARIAFTDREKLTVFEAEESQNEEQLRTIYLGQDNDLNDDEASNAYMWDAIARCHRASKSAALKTGSWITPSAFSS